ncbi:hypothetical protein [Rhodalgimonas zhirmunskyi]|uniref:Apolipoprotein acyltransferase n=1 Tax=Rhodalgimonas zhirmunskyi TaxID=2964767 RepID=A0AAJ1X6Z5_9RHOB|nr:hypothetical protein [Rhodoalgimonas zhirmunskyi]MDQ2095184.1 hypothetical protein [Rhodoalgimonas zhirmunskyi]
MIAWVAALLGVIFGIIQARRKGGKALDLAQYGAVYGIFFAVIGVIVQIVIIRFGFM